MNKDYVISTDKSKLDVTIIHNFLSNRSYWGRGRTIEAVQRTIDNPLCTYLLSHMHWGSLSL